jgi:hypothetical protein
MAQKELSHNKFFSISIACYLLTLVVSSCNYHSPEQQHKVVLNYTIDTLGIPNDTVLITNRSIKIVNGIYFFNTQRFSGIVKELYANGVVKNYRSLYGGMLHGRYKSFYENGNCYENRLYKNNLSTGKHFAYWPDGITLKFEYNYYEERREGLQKKWYPSGKPFIFSNYNNDHEDGLQQGWRPNGKLYLNYVVKDGYVYGLQQSALCYTLINQELKER